MLNTNPSKLLFFMFLLMGTMVTISSNSWLATWIGLEINLLAFIPLISTTCNTFSTEASLFYFLIQALGSAVLLFSILTSFLFKNSLLGHIAPFSLMISFTLFLKMGVSPFHQWFPKVLDGLSWMNCFLLMTWQKLGPFMILTYLMKNSSLIYLMGLLSVIIGSLGGLNQLSLRKIMAYSSINHIGWMIMACLFSNNLWFIYFVLYSLLSFIIILSFFTLNLSQLNQILLSKSTLPEIFLFIFSMNLLSLGGLPPFLGFLPKWLVIESLSSLVNSSLPIFTIIMFSLITLFYYMRLIFPLLLLSFYNSSLLKIKSPTSSNPLLLITLFSSLSILGLILTPILPFWL